MSDEGEGEVRDSGVRPVLPVSGQFSALSNGEELTSVAVANKLLSSDTDLKLKTRIDDAYVLTLLDVLEAHAEDAFGKDGHTTKTLRVLGRSLRENKCSEGGWRSDQIKEILIADLEATRMAGEGVGAKLFDKSGGK